MWATATADTSFPVLAFSSGRQIPTPAVRPVPFVGDLNPSGPNQVTQRNPKPLPVRSVPPEEVDLCLPSALRRLLSDLFSCLYPTCGPGVLVLFPVWRLRGAHPLMGVWVWGVKCAVCRRSTGRSKQFLDLSSLLSRNPC